MQTHPRYVGPAVSLSGTLNLMGAGPTGPLKKITKIRAAYMSFNRIPSITDKTFWSLEIR